MYDISADNANKKPKKNNIQKLSLLRSFKHLLGRLRSHADCHNRKLHYKELLKLYIPDRSIRGRASGEGTKETREVAKGGLTGCPRTGILAKQPIDLAQLILS